MNVMGHARPEVRTGSFDSRQMAGSRRPPDADTLVQSRPTPAVTWLVGYAIGLAYAALSLTDATSQILDACPSDATILAEARDQVRGLAELEAGIRQRAGELLAAAADLAVRGSHHMQ